MSRPEPGRSAVTPPALRWLRCSRMIPGLAVQAKADPDHDRTRGRYTRGPAPQDPFRWRSGGPSKPGAPSAIHGCAHSRERVIPWRCAADRADAQNVQTLAGSVPLESDDKRCLRGQHSPGHAAPSLCQRTTPQDGAGCCGIADRGRIFVGVRQSRVAPHGFPRASVRHASGRGTWHKSSIDETLNHHP